MTAVRSASSTYTTACAPVSLDEPTPASPHVPAVPRSIDVVADEAAGPDGRRSSTSPTRRRRRGQTIFAVRRSVRGGPDSERSLPPTEPDTRLSLKDGAELTIEAETGTSDRAAAVDLEGRVTDARLGGSVDRPGESTPGRDRVGDQPVEGRRRSARSRERVFASPRGIDFVDGPAHPLIGSGA